jgi:hypothetical protein
MEYAILEQLKCWAAERRGHVQDIPYQPDGQKRKQGFRRYAILTTIIPKDGETSILDNAEGAEATVASRARLSCVER